MELVGACEGLSRPSHCGESLRAVGYTASPTDTGRVMKHSAQSNGVAKAGHYVLLYRPIRQLHVCGLVPLPVLLITSLWLVHITPLDGTTTQSYTWSRGRSTHHAQVLAACDWLVTLPSHTKGLIRKVVWSRSAPLEGHGPRKCLTGMG